MADTRITLDNPIFAGQLRDFSTVYKRRPVMAVKPRRFSDISPPTRTRPHHKKETKLSYKQLETVQAEPAPGYTNLRQFEAPEIETAVIPRPQYRERRSKTPILLVVMAFLLFALGLGIAIMGFRTNHKAAAEIKKISSSSVSANVDQTKPDAASYGAYSVDPWLPRYLVIPSLSVQARIKQVGADSKGQLQAPYNIYDAGWYKYSSKPGDAGGAMLIDGHVSGPTKRGVFYGLKKLVNGDIITVQRGDGHGFSFRVVKSQTYDADKVDMTAALISADPEKLGLNLITCSGKVDSQTNQYNQRTIVFAVSD